MSKLFRLLIPLILGGCASPAQHFADVAKEHGFIASTIKGLPFEHRLYANRLVNQTGQDKVLHVYLDGDGTPWQNETWPSEDPTSRNPFILSLMAQDSTASILLGRPCYHGLNINALCHEGLWTSKRYAPEIVNSMVSALNHWLQKQPFNKVVLIGHSGGGALAVLMADKIPAVQTVVTFAANLNVAAWSEAHGYPTLSESLDPIAQKKLPPRIKQIHLAGAEDEVVPPQVIKSYVDLQQNVDYLLFPDFDHQSGWEEAWQQILQKF